jgi:hypothetical protein
MTSPFCSAMILFVAATSSESKVNGFCTATT